MVIGNEMLLELRAGRSYDAGFIGVHNASHRISLKSQSVCRVIGIQAGSPVGMAHEALRIKLKV